MKSALILSGGGARAAYQVGVLKAIAELLPATGHNPFQIICGTSSGAINAAKLAVEADDFHLAVDNLVKLWSNLESASIHEVGFTELMGSTLKLLASFFNSGIAAGRPLSLFDNSPLEQLISEQIAIERLPAMIESGYLEALCITALGYTSGQSISFFQAGEHIQPWQTGRRLGARCSFTHKHLLASAALPAIFPPVKINREYFGDGAIRQTAPMSPALHMGANKLLVIGVSGNRRVSPRRVNQERPPSLAMVLGQLLNSAFIDSLEEDVEMMTRFNRFIALMNDAERTELKVKAVDALVIKPSIEFDQIAAEYLHCLPLSMRVFLRTIGATRRGGGSSLASYILFESEYCNRLIECGYADAMEQSETIRKFVGSCQVK